MNLFEIFTVVNIQSYRGCSKNERRSLIPFFCGYQNFPHTSPQTFSPYKSSLQNRDSVIEFSTDLIFNSISFACP